MVRGSIARAERSVSLHAKAGEKLDETFIAKNAPRVKQAVETFGRFLSDVKAKKAA